MKLDVKRFGWYLVFIFASWSITAQSFEEQEKLLPCELENSTGVAVADYDLDGDMDAYIVAAEVFDKENPLSWSRLMRNDGGMGFTDATLSAGLINWEAETRDGTMGAKMGASWGDYDNDGYPDIFLSNFGLDELWHNERDGTFRNVSKTAEVEGCAFCYSTNAVWWDYDQDGDLDLYVSDWLKANRFYRNDGGGTFTDMSEVTGLDDRRHTFSALPIDLNKDGLLDLYVINDNGPNRFFWNRGEDNFEEATTQLGLSDQGNGMGVDVCDYNNDGFFDIYVTNIYDYLPNPFFVSDGNGAFTDQSAELGIDNTGWGWGIRFFDADHDLDEDLYVVNGFYSPVAEGDRNKFFDNQQGHFQDISERLELDRVEIGMGLEVFDFDADGDLDLLIGNRDARAGFYQNNTIETAENSNWIQIRLEGTASNRNAFGATVKMSCGGQDYYRYHSGVNLFGQSVQPVHFGLNAYAQADTLEVHWPSGHVDTFYGLEANQLLTLKEGTGEEPPSEPEAITEATAVFPNPFRDQLWLKTSRAEAEEAEFSLMDIMGRNVQHKKITIPPGEGFSPLLTTGQTLEAGIYFYSLLGKELEFSGRIIRK